MHLHIHIVGDYGSENTHILKEYYLEGLRKHKIKTSHPDSGVDLFCPRDLTIPPNQTCYIDLGIQCAAYTDKLFGEMYRQIPAAYYVYPRSSMSKTPLRLANSVGIIDSGYRGNILAAVDNISNESFQLKRGTRLFQICAPDLSHIIVTLVDSLDKTSRGAGGFGSTGQ
jgi:dUTP pyrophosphatase